MPFSEKKNHCQCSLTTTTALVTYHSALTLHTHTQQAHSAVRICTTIIWWRGGGGKNVLPPEMFYYGFMLLYIRNRTIYDGMKEKKRWNWSKLLFPPLPFFSLSADRVFVQSRVFYSQRYNRNPPFELYLFSRQKGI